ncbi:heterokaryon incompatibility protein-domain-containing protein [Pisolithus thermaeus]|nr:heterokaryon incompatibility protein-domain-containing protein [Pisolithus thermaeus]
MKLLDVKAVLDREKDIQEAESEYEVLKMPADEDTTRYAILSHRWGVEVTYEEMIGLMKMERRKRDEVRQRYGYQKIIKTCELAMKDGYEWVWIDTCCIDKRSSSELSEAINSMYRWYQNAQICYAYLNDVDSSVFPTEQNAKFSKSNGWPEWFVRGWTLQELIAPKRIEFFNQDWAPIGNKRYLAPMLGVITRIPREVLMGGLAAKRVSVAQVMSWAAGRKTTRVEDRAYSLMGLFGVNMPMLYGEGKKAFRRLQLEIIRESSDHSIFAWSSSQPGGALAESPGDFWYCRNMRKLEPDEYVETLIKEYIDQSNLGGQRRVDILGRKGRAHQRKLATLRDAVNSQQFRTFTVNNAGIQVFLPVVPFPNSPSHFRAILSCTSDVNLQTIDLAPSGSGFSRTTGTMYSSSTYPEFKTLYLTHHQDANETLREFTLDDVNASYYGFTRHGTHPHEFSGDIVTLSPLTDNLVVIVYANNDCRSRFAVGLGYHLGQGWVHVVYDDHPEVNWTPWSDFAHTAYSRMWEARAKHAQSFPKHKYDYGCRHDHFIKHAHLPRSIWAARVIWGRWEMDNFKVVVDIDQCPGCCDGPHAWTVTPVSTSSLCVCVCVCADLTIYVTVV